MARYLFFFIPVFIALAFAPAFAQSGAVCLFSDVDGTQCDFQDAAPGAVFFYVFHTQTPGATAVQFAAPFPSCMTGVSFLGDVNAFPVTVGDSQDGVSIAYGGCFSGPIHVLTITGFGNGLTAADCLYPVMPIPGEAGVRMVDCDSRNLPATGGVAYINSMIPCSCEAVPVPPMIELSEPALFFGLDFITLDFDIANAGAGTLSWNVDSNESWISVNPASGNGDGTVSVTVDRTNLLQGNHSGMVMVTSNGGTAHVVVYASAPGVGPMLSVSPTYLFFGPGEVVKYFQVENVGDGTLQWNLTFTAPWLDTNVLGGTNDGTVRVVVDRTGLPEGTHTGAVVVESNAGIETVTIDLIVPQQVPALDFSPALLSFPDGTDELFLNITNVGTGTLFWDVAPSEPWLSVEPTSGADNASVTVTVDRTGLAPGNYNATLAITSNGGSGDVAVTMEIPEPIPILGFSPASLTFEVGVSQKSLQITNEGNGTLSWAVAPSAPWLSANPISGSNDGTVIVDVDRSGLADGNHAAQLDITSNGGNDNVPVIMKISTVPVLTVDRTLLVFNQFSQERHFQISNTGVGTLEWSLTPDTPWIVIDPPLSGSGDADVTVRIDGDELPPGPQTGHIDVTSNGGDASVTVRFNPLQSYPGWLQPASDVQGQSCYIFDDVPKLLTVHIVHLNTTGVTASSFASPMPPCMLATYLSDTVVFPATVGNSQIGVSVGYGACRVSPIHVLTMNYFGQGLTPPCCLYPVLPNPQSASGLVEAVDCTSTLRSIAGVYAVVNASLGCDCGVQLAVHESTWGRIKSLYAPPGE